MGNEGFGFRQFTVRHDRCAHKVGTDGVLLGAWACVDGCRDVLDIGCGCGVVSLMVAQRNTTARVCGVEVDEEAARQAGENVRASAFADRVTVRRADIREFAGRFDCIVCNPPFFAEDTLSPDRGRALARSSTSLTYGELWGAVATLSADGALFNVILPHGQLRRFGVYAPGYGFSILRLCRVHTTETKPPRRVMVTYRRGGAELVEDCHLVLRRADGEPSAEYAKLTESFYIRL